MRHTVDALLKDLGVERERERIALAVSEACSNVVLHAYRDTAPPEHEDAPGSPAPPGPLTIAVSIAPAAIDVKVVDDGCGVLPRLDSPGAGFGLALIRRLADEVTVGRENGRTVVAMTFWRESRERTGGDGSPRHVLAQAA